MLCSSSNNFSVKPSHCATAAVEALQISPAHLIINLKIIFHKSSFEASQYNDLTHVR